MCFLIHLCCSRPIVLTSAGGRFQAVTLPRLTKVLLCSAIHVSHACAMAKFDRYKGSCRDHVGSVIKGYYLYVNAYVLNRIASFRIDEATLAMSSPTSDRQRLDLS